MTPESFKRDFLPLGEKLYKTALRILTNPQDAEDAVQDTYVRMWELRERLEGVGKAEAYFMEALKNRCFTLLRNKRVEVELEEESGRIPHEDPPDKEEGEEEGEELLERLIRQLPERARTILNMRHTGMMEMREIAEQTGESQENVRAILSRSRRKLKEQYIKAIRK